jgi:pilus assembly protein TadC
MRKMFAFPSIILVALPSISLLLVLIGYQNWGDFLRDCIFILLGLLLRLVVVTRNRKKSQSWESEQ